TTRLIGRLCKRGNALSRPVLMGRGLDGYFYPFGLRAVFKPRRGRRSRPISVAIARGKHLFPFRTEPLSPSAPMVLGGQLPGRVGRRRSLTHQAALGRPFAFLDSESRNGGLRRLAEAPGALPARGSASVGFAAQRHTSRSRRPW